MKVIITGSDGFIGSHLTNYLASLNYDVYAIVWEKSKAKDRMEESEHIHVIEGNLFEIQNLVEKLPFYSDAFIHLAWAGVTPNERNDFAFQMQNVEMAINTICLASMIQTKKFIFPGSTMEYSYWGEPINIRAIPSPYNAYGVAKIATRYACSIMSKKIGIPFIYCVISGIYSEDRNDNNVIYYTINKLLNNEIPALTKLEQLWDYIHIDDVVYGFQLIIEKGKAGAFYTLGHGDNWPLSKYIFQIRDIINPNLPIGIGEVPYSNNEIPSSCVDLSALQHDTGYTPRIDFAEGISRVIDRIREQKSGGLFL